MFNVTDEVLNEAITQTVNQLLLIVLYFFGFKENKRYWLLVLMCLQGLQHAINIYAIHTNFDNVFKV